MEKIRLTDPETNEELELFVLEQTCISGVNYYLATEEEEEDSVAYILKETEADGEDVLCVIVEDETELDAISRVFAEMLDDVDFV